MRTTRSSVVDSTSTCIVIIRCDTLTRIRKDAPSTHFSLFEQCTMRKFNNNPPIELEHKAWWRSFDASFFFSTKSCHEDLQTQVFFSTTPPRRILLISTTLKYSTKCSWASQIGREEVLNGTWIAQERKVCWTLVHHQSHNQHSRIYIAVFPKVEKKHCCTNNPFKYKSRIQHYYCPVT